jgi:hypothetical protein
MYYETDRLFLEAERYARLVREYQYRQAAVEKAHADAERESRLAAYERELQHLGRRGFVLDVAEELEQVKDMTPDRFERHKDMIVRRYVRAPAAEDGPGIDPGEPSLSEGQFEKAIQYQREHPDKPWQECERYGRR